MKLWTMDLSNPICPICDTVLRTFSFLFGIYENSKTVKSSHLYIYSGNWDGALTVDTPFVGDTNTYKRLKHYLV